jgi:hypothetical protein
MTFAWLISDGPNAMLQRFSATWILVWKGAPEHGGSNSTEFL